jgi:hypothetical protein
MNASPAFFSNYTVYWPSKDYEHLKPSLLTGGDKKVRFTFLRERAKTFLCKTHGTSSHINCHTCHQIESRQHVDLIWIEAEEGEKIKVEALAVLRERLGKGPLFGPLLVIVIPACETLNIAGQNMLLKLLEEPPRGWVFLLSTPQPEQLLATLRSRCEPVALKWNPSSQIEAPQRLVAMAQGDLEWINFWQTEEGASLLQDFETWFQNPHRSLFDRLMEKAHKSPERFPYWITTLERLLWLEIREAKTKYIALFESIQNFYAQPHLNRKLWTQHFLHLVHENKGGSSGHATRSKLSL